MIHVKRVGRKMDKFTPELHVVSIWHEIGVDFIGPFHHPSRKGNKYILTICDYYYH